MKQLIIFILILQASWLSAQNGLLVQTDTEAYYKKDVYGKYQLTGERVLPNNLYMTIRGNQDYVLWDGPVIGEKTFKAISYMYVENTGCYEWKDSTWSRWLYDPKNTQLLRYFYSEGVENLIAFHVIKEVWE